MPDSQKNQPKRRSVALLDEHGTLIHHEPGILPIYSIAKTMIASAIIASSIDIDTEIRTWIDKRWLPNARGITIRHLLDHSAGLKDYFMSPAYRQAIEDHEPPWSNERFAKETLHQEKLFDPGTGFSYSNPGYWLLIQILQALYQKPWPDILRDVITQPLGMNDTHVVQGQFAEDLPNYPAEWVWHGVILSSAKDIVQFLASDMIPPLTIAPRKVPGNQPAWSDPHYGFGLMMEPGVMHGHNGGGPGYTAAAYHFEQPCITGCVLLADDRPDAALHALREEIQRQESSQTHRN